MIDRVWFARVATMVGVKIPEGDIGHLAAILGDEKELLPYLLLSRSALADWPVASVALRAAAKGVIRPRAIPANAHSFRSPGLIGECKEEILDAMGKAQDHDLHAMNGMVKARRSISGRPQPNDFIE